MNISQFKFIIVFGVSGLLTFSPLAAIADAQTEIQADYNKMNTAIGQKDIDTALSLFSDPVVFVDQSAVEHPSSKADLRAFLTQECSSVDTIEAKTTILKTEAVGKDIVTSVKVDSIYTKVSPQTHASIKLIVHETDRDYWVKADNGWLLKRSRTMQKEKHLQK